MAFAGITSGMVVDAHTFDQIDGIRSLLTQTVNGAPRVTNRCSVIDQIVDFIDGIIRLMGDEH